MTQQGEDAAEDERLWSDEIRSLVSGWNLVVLIGSVALGVWGVFESMMDAAGDGFAGNLAIAAPSIYAAWCMLEMIVWRVNSLVWLMLRLVSACLIAPLVAAFPIAVIQAVAVAFPGVRDVIARAADQNHDFHYFWSEGLVSQLYLLPLASYGIGTCIALGVALIVVLPVLAVRSPGIVAEGSHIEQVEPRKRSSTTAFVFIGLSITIVGIVLWNFGEGGPITEFPRDLGQLMNALSHGYFNWDQAMWLFGAVFVVIGVAAMGWGCVRVLFARARS